MRDRRKIQASAIRDDDNRSGAASPLGNTAAPLGRVFLPDLLDLDAVAEAVRLLLAPGASESRSSQDRPETDLLSSPPGGTYVVEANEAP